MSEPREPAAAGHDPVARVTPLELFFDLVFVFTLTQLTSVLVEELSWERLFQVAVMLGLIFYMYDGYAWLTNAVPARGAGRQALLLGGMAGYLVIAIAVPSAFDGDGLAFGLALLAITTIHAALFARSASLSSATAMRKLAPRNLGGAMLVVIGGAFGGDAQTVLWTAAVLLEWITPPAEDFEIGPAHFVERHGLLVIVAIGESVVAIGVGASFLDLDAQLIALVALGLAISAGLWWTYFGDEEEEALVGALTDASGPARARIGIWGFGYAHYLILLGVILAAVGIEEAIAHPDEHLELAFAATLSGGVALFIGADAWFRALLGLGRTRTRALAAAAVLVAIPFATEVSAAAGLAATAVLFTGALAAERPGRLRHA